MGTIPTEKLEATRALLALQLLSKAIASCGTARITDEQAAAMVANAATLAKPLAATYGLLLGVHDEAPQGNG